MKKSSRAKKTKRAKKIRFLMLFSFIFLTVFTSFYYFKFYSTKKVTASNISKKNMCKKSKTADAIPASILNSNNEITDSQNKDLRKFPYPYNAMIALCSDIDDTTVDEFKTYHKFLNTKEKTPYGEGLGLDIGDSMWMYMANNIDYKVDNQGINSADSIMTFFRGTDITQNHNADEITHFINSGWIDCIHTFGDFSSRNEKRTSFNRKLAQSAWDTLNSINFKPTVWINHGNKSNRQNFGAYGTSNFMNYQQGDNPQSPYYHSDLTIGNGIKYVWDSINDSNFGHDFPLYEISLRDGKKVWGFYRYTNNVENNRIFWTWIPAHIHQQLNKDNLDSLVNNKYYSIVGQHFGVNTEDLFTDENINSLKLLKSYETNGKIIVAKTSRLLNYANVHKYLMYNKVTEDNKTYINISSVDDPIFGKYVPTLDNIRGLTFYCNDPKNTVILLNKNKISSDVLEMNPKDSTGQASVSIKWFEPNYTDYAK